MNDKGKRLLLRVLVIVGIIVLLWYRIARINGWMFRAP